MMVITASKLMRLFAKVQCGMCRSQLDTEAAGSVFVQVWML
jgi:hypothetical protein